MISKELVKKLRKIEIHTARLANDQLAGSYHSIFKGRGMAFSEVRQYQPGDDVRFIDWNVSARMNEAYVKVFTEEREMTVMILVDMSASGIFGTHTRNKIETAAEVAALMAFSAIKNNDQVGLILFTDRVERFVPPKKGKGHVMRVVTEILNAKPKHTGTDIKAALDRLGKVTKRRSVALLISDFQSPPFDHALRVASAKHDLIPIQVVDPKEQSLPDVGLLWLEDLETGEQVEVDTSSATVRSQFEAHVRQHNAHLQQLFNKLRLDHVRIDTHSDYVRPLSNMFRLRQKRMGGFR